jgi:hypothetical protein
MVTAPKCEGSVTPAKCSSNVQCQGSCQGHANIQASCTPPTVKLECAANASASVTAVVATVEKNLPILIQAAKIQGPMLVDAAGKLTTEASAVVSDIGSQSGKALACATVAGKAAVTASASVSVSVMASASVSGSASGGT